MEQGPLEETLIRRAKASKSAIPKKIAEAPHVSTGLMFYFQAFLALSSCRPVGFGEGPIPWLAAFQYAQATDLDEEGFEDLWTLVSLMDAAYLKFRAKKASEGKPPPPTK